MPGLPTKGFSNEMHVARIHAIRRANTKRFDGQKCRNVSEFPYVEALVEWKNWFHYKYWTWVSVIACSEATIKMVLSFYNEMAFPEQFGKLSLDRPDDPPQQLSMGCLVSSLNYTLGGKFIDCSSDGLRHVQKIDKNRWNIEYMDEKHLDAVFEGDSQQVDRSKGNVALETLRYLLNATTNIQVKRIKQNAYQLLKDEKVCGRYMFNTLPVAVSKSKKRKRS